MDASKIESNKSSTISYVCMDTIGRIHHLRGKINDDIPIIEVEMIAIQEAISTATDRRLDNIIVESYSLMQLTQIQVKIGLQVRFSIE